MLFNFKTVWKGLCKLHLVERNTVFIEAVIIWLQKRRKRIFREALGKGFVVEIICMENVAVVEWESTAN